MSIFFKRAASAAILVSASSAAWADHVIYTIAPDGRTIVGVPADADPGTIGPDDATLIPVDAGGDPISLDAITFRPQTSELYGYDATAQTLYIIDTGTGQASPVVTSGDLPGDDAFVQFDTNPNLDAFRFIDSSGTNTVYFPDDTANATPSNAGRIIAESVPGEAGNIAPLTYADGYDETGTPSLIGNGYTNQLPLFDAQAQPDALLQYVLDAGTDTLGILDNNAGTVDFVADVTLEGSILDFDIGGGFDVFTAPDGTDIGYANLLSNGTQSIFQIDLSNGMLTSLFSGVIETTSLAVFVPADEDMAPVPLPAAGWLLLAGLGGLGAARRRKG